jgi:hypothetical protein
VDLDRLLEQSTRFRDIAGAVPHRLRLHDERLAVVRLEATPARRSIFSFSSLPFGFLTPLAVHWRRIASKKRAKVNRCRGGNRGLRRDGL